MERYLDRCITQTNSLKVVEANFFSSSLPVSYTHLDVYKRQALLHANEELVNALMAFDQLAEEGDMASLNERDSDEDDQEDNEAYISDEASIPSYTSRGGAAQPNDPFSDNNKIKN